MNKRAIIVKRLAASIGAEIRLHPRAHGGSIFSFSVPVIPGETDASMPPPESVEGLFDRIAGESGNLAAPASAA